MYPDYSDIFRFYSGINTGMFGMVQLTGWLVSIAMYVLSSLGLYTIARNRGISKPWLAWIPVVNLWTLGAISDQFQYVARGQVRSKRKALLALSIISFVLSVVMMTSGTVFIFQAIAYHVELPVLLSWAAPSLICFLISLVAFLGVGIAKVIVRYIALYDLYTSCDPGNNTLYLVLGILFRVTEPFFLFFNRNKELGMPPRRQNVYADTQADYL